jgi:hypothetical protein
VIAPKNPEPGKTIDLKQIQPVVERLQKVIAEYLAPAKSMKLKIGGPDILRVLEQAIVFAENPEARVAFGERPEDYFLDGLYEELIQQPGAIFEKVTDPEGKEQYVPLSDEVWLACLKNLRDSVKKGVG